MGGGVPLTEEALLAPYPLQDLSQTAGAMVSVSHAAAPEQPEPQQQDRPMQLKQQSPDGASQTKSAQPQPHLPTCSGQYSIPAPDSASPPHAAQSSTHVPPAPPPLRSPSPGSASAATVEN